MLDGLRLSRVRVVAPDWPISGGKPELPGNCQLLLFKLKYNVLFRTEV